MIEHTEAVTEHLATLQDKELEDLGYHFHMNEYFHLEVTPSESIKEWLVENVDHETLAEHCEIEPYDIEEID